MTLLEAINSENWEFIQQMIKKDSELVNVIIDEGDYKGFSLLSVAVINGQRELVTELLSKGADVNHIVNSGEFLGASVLHIAAASNNMSENGSIGEILILHGADRSYEPEYGDFANQTADEFLLKLRKVEVTSAVENDWVFQKNQKKVKIYDSPEEWDLIMNYLSNTKQTLSGPFKVNRFLLKKFLANNPQLNIDEDLIQHSFYVIPGDSPGDYRLLMISRSKKYSVKDIEYTEGILGYGSFGRVNPCLVRNAIAYKLQNDTPGVFAIKTMGEITGTLDTNTINSNHEFMIMKFLGRDTNIMLRDRAIDSNRDILSRASWIGGSAVGRSKVYIFQPIMEGSSPDKNQTKHLNLIDKLYYALALVKAVKELHDKNVIHRDIKPGNLSVMHIPKSPKSPRFLAMTIDFDCAIILNDTEGVYRSAGLVGTPGYTAPEVETQHIYSKSSDIYALGIVMKNLELFSASDPLITALTSIDPSKRPDVEYIIMEIMDRIGINSKQSARYIHHNKNKYITTNQFLNPHSKPIKPPRRRG